MELWVVIFHFLALSLSLFNVVQRRWDLRVWLRRRCGVGKDGVVYTALWVFFSVATHRGLSCSKCRDLLRQRKGKDMEERASSGYRTFNTVEMWKWEREGWVHLNRCAAFQAVNGLYWEVCVHVSVTIAAVIIDRGRRVMLLIKTGSLKCFGI